jgi:hypothetical protein
MVECPIEDVHTRVHDNPSVGSDEEGLQEPVFL